jgi:protein-disulfide isomerase
MESDECTPASNLSCYYRDCLDDNLCALTFGGKTDQCTTDQRCQFVDGVPQQQGNIQSVNSTQANLPDDRLFANFANLDTYGQSSVGPVDAPANGNVNYISNGNRIGNPAAPVQIEIFQDYSCGMCKAQFQSGLKYLLQREVTDGLVQLVFREFPLLQRERDMKISMAAQCAAEQNKYVAYAEKLYENFGKLEDNLILRLATETGLEPAPFAECLASRRHLATIRRDVAKGKLLEVPGTPTLLINGKLFPGAKNYSELSTLVDEAYRR